MIPDSINILKPFTCDPMPMALRRDRPLLPGFPVPTAIRPAGQLAVSPTGELVLARERTGLTLGGPTGTSIVDYRGFFTGLVVTRGVVHEAGRDPFWGYGRTSGLAGGDA